MLHSKRYLAIGISAAVGILLLVSFGSQLWGGTGNSFDLQERKLKIAVVTDALFSDRGWGGSSFNASQFIEDKYQVEMTAVDNIPIADIESTLTKYAAEKYDLIIAHGFQWGEPAIKIGKQFPQVRIVVFTGLVKSDNVASIFPMQQEGSFLLGALAGMMTKSGVIGFIGGEEYPNVINIYEGFKQGAQSVNPDVEVIGTYLNDWDNPAKGREAASALIRIQNADILFQVADTSGHGVIAAAEQNHVYALGAVQDQNALAPDTVLSSFVLDTGKAYDQAVQMVLTNTFRGEIFKPGIERGKGQTGDEGIVYLAPFHNLESEVPSAVNSRLEQLSQDIIAKRITVPERYQ
jgi:basic membrane protein A and related proteins